MSLQDRLRQCREDKTAIEANELELMRRIEESERTYKIGDIFWRDKPDITTGTHYFRLVNCSEWTIGLQALDEPKYLFRTKRFVTLNLAVLVSDPHCIRMAEVRRMTRFPKGLRHVPVGTLVITEKKRKTSHYPEGGMR